MAKRKFRSAAQGRGFKQLGSGLRAAEDRIQEQRKIETDSLRLAQLQQKEENQNYISGLTDAARFEEGVLKESHKLEDKVRTRKYEALRKLAQTDSFSSVIGDEFRPGSECQTDEQMIQHIKETVWTVFHPSSTCRMGPDPNSNVVDSGLRVHGIEGLRVADASIFPQLVCGNINAATIMVGEKASDLILQDQINGK